MELDRKITAIAIITGLPLQARWMIHGTPLDFDFSGAGDGLRSLPDETLDDGNAGASDLLVFGEQDFAAARRLQVLCANWRSVWGRDSF